VKDSAGIQRVKVAVDVAQLSIGMYVCELDRPWRETPFLFQGFEIRSQEEIDTLRRYCRKVYILEREWHSLGSSVPARPDHGAWQPGQSTALHVEQAIFKLNNHPAARPVYADLTTMQQEAALVRDTFVEARLLIQELLHDAKLGRSLNLPGVKRVVRAMTESVLRNPDALMCFAQLKRKDEYSALHSLRVAILALTFGRHLGMKHDRLETLGLGALLHDIGKVRVPEEILAKPGALTPEETALMQRHVDWGVEILSPTRQVPEAALDVVRGHHERYDGSGYRQGLKGDAISEFSMIGAIVDHYDAITSDRAYRNALSPHTVLKKMYEWRNSLFHGGLVERFIQCLGIYPIGSVVALNSGEVGVVAAINRQQRLKPHVMLVFQPDRRPFDQMPIANLATLRTSDNRPCEIERVLEPDAIDIDPARYLRAAVSF
jgi:putative nucleotidyltransferase with HDIG domain